MVRLIDMPYAYGYTKMYWDMVSRDASGQYYFCGFIKLKPEDHITANHLREITILLNNRESQGITGRDIVTLQNLSMELLMCRATFFRTLNIHSKVQEPS